MSPGLTSRPSLSAREAPQGRGGGACVAGINLPAFVERTRAAAVKRRPEGCVAGINLPAFVERPSTCPPLSTCLRCRRD